MKSKYIRVDSKTTGTFYTTSYFKKSDGKLEPQQLNLKMNRPSNHESKPKPVKAQNLLPKNRPTYPWTCLLDVSLVAELEAIQGTFDLNSRSEALALILSRSLSGNKLMTSKEQTEKYKVFYQTFMEKNLPKAKRHYDKYFHK